MISLLRQENYRQMPWKNGKGLTLEIARYPHDASDFLWRLSLAPVTEPCEFSEYPDYDRWLGLIKGEGLLLNSRSLKSGQCVHFPGEEKIRALPIGGQVLDLGLIYKRGQVRAQMSFENLSAEYSKTITLEPSQSHFFVCVDGKISTPFLSFDPGETLHMMGPVTTQIKAGTPEGAQYLWIRLGH